MSYAIIGLVGIIICWKWGDWRNWKQYYPTVMYLMIGDLVADFLLYSKPLFAFGSFVERYPFLDIGVMLTLYPATVILFLSFYPRPIMKQILYTLLWVAIYVVLEVIASLTGGFCYHNGWNIWYSVIFDVVMFPLLVLHYKKPLWVWPISVVMCFALVWWFRIPLKS